MVIVVAGHVDIFARFRVLLPSVILELFPYVDGVLGDVYVFHSLHEVDAEEDGVSTLLCRLDG